MTKKFIDVEFNDVRWLLHGCTLQEALYKIKHWIKEYGGNTKFDIGQVYEEYVNDREYAYVRLTGTREETDAEYNKRITQEMSLIKSQELHDRSEFERLTKKFGEGNE